MGRRPFIHIFQQLRSANASDVHRRDPWNVRVQLESTQPSGATNMVEPRLSGNHVLFLLVPVLQAFPQQLHCKEANDFCVRSPEKGSLMC